MKGRAVGWVLRRVINRGADEDRADGSDVARGGVRVGQLGEAVPPAVGLLELRGEADGAAGIAVALPVAGAESRVPARAANAVDAQRAPVAAVGLVGRAAEGDFDLKAAGVGEGGGKSAVGLKGIAADFGRRRRLWGA